MSIVQNHTETESMYDNCKQQWKLWHYKQCLQAQYQQCLQAQYHTLYMTTVQLIMFSDHMIAEAQSY